MGGPGLLLSNLIDGCSWVPVGTGTSDPSLQGVREVPRGRVWWWWVGPCDHGQCPFANFSKSSCFQSTDNTGGCGL